MYKVKINNDLCKQCRICMEFCPKNVFESSESGMIVPQRSKDCIGCNMCVFRCPDFAIEVEEVK